MLVEPRESATNLFRILLMTVSGVVVRRAWVPTLRLPRQPSHSTSNGKETCYVQKI